MPTSESKNFLFKFADAFQLLNKSMNYDVAIACASALISAGLYNIRIPTSRGFPLSLDEMDIIVGLSGIIKSIPLNMTAKIAKELKIKLPSFTTSEGISSYFAETKKDDKTGEETYVHKPYGIIINDELSRKFSEGKRKEHAVGCIESYSSLYDHELEETYLASKGLRKPQSPYVSILGATITNYLPFIPDHFFSQGLAGRFNWIYCDFNAEKQIVEDITDLTDFNKVEPEFSKCIEMLAKLYAKNPLDPTYITLDADVNKIFMEFDKECDLEWEYEASENIWKIDYQYLKRLPEMAIKQAGRYAIGRQIDSIIKKGFAGVTISKGDMQTGIDHVKRSKAALDAIFLLREDGIRMLVELKKPRKEREKPYHYTAEMVVRCLRFQLDGMANTRDWIEATGIGDYKTFEKYKNEVVATGEVYQVNKRTITDPEEIHKYKANLSATKIWRVAGGQKTDGRYLTEEEDWQYLALSEFNQRKRNQLNAIKDNIISEAESSWKEQKKKEKEEMEKNPAITRAEWREWQRQKWRERRKMEKELEEGKIAEACKALMRERSEEWQEILDERECLVTGKTLDELKEEKWKKENFEVIEYQPDEGEAEDDE